MSQTVNDQEFNNENRSIENMSTNNHSLRMTDPDLCSLLTRKQPRFVPQAPKCANCNKSVYKAEELRAANKTFHKLCFKCTSCNKLLETNILTEHQGNLFCRNCYAKSFGPKGVGFGTNTMSTENNNFLSLNLNHKGLNNNYETNENQSVKHVQVTPALRSTFSTLNHNNNIQNMNGNGNMTSPPTNGNYQMSAFNYEKRSSVSTITYGGSDKCARCTKPVYAAEKVFAAGKPFHKLCFSCSVCKKLLSSMNICDNSESEIFCKACYGKQYGPKGVGFGIGAGLFKAN